VHHAVDAQDGAQVPGPDGIGPHDGQMSVIHRLFRKLNMHQRFLAITALVVSSLTAACGGGSDAESAADRVTAVPLRAFADGSGIGRQGSLLFYVPDLGESVKAANEADGSDNGLSLPDDSNLPVVAQYPLADLRRGVATFEGDAFNVAVLSDKRSEELAAAFIELPGQADIVVVGGLPLTGVPSSGIHRYTGTQSASERSFLAPAQIGAFTLDVNFSAGTFVFPGQTSTFTATALGRIDAATGLFAFASVTVVADGRPYVGHLYGLLHGAGAGAVTGIIVTDDFQADYSAAFLGLR
jgi:hypothetical protein